jgi:L-asparaginase/Glu-tRNA(Gln) amidotransferase subunit D
VSGQDLLAVSPISAGFLDLFKARLLLHVLLSGGAARE